MASEISTILTLGRKAEIFNTLNYKYIIGGLSLRKKAKTVNSALFPGVCREINHCYQPITRDEFRRPFWILALKVHINHLAFKLS
jgi:hypothetical protein